MTTNKIKHQSISLCPAGEIAERSAKGFEISGDNIFALRFDDEIHVYRNSCPHLGVELNWLEDQFFDADGALIQCATHGALFDPATGVCLAGPCRGESLKRLPSHVDAGQLYVEIEE